MTGSDQKLTAPLPRNVKHMFLLILVRYVGIMLLALSLVFSIINPILAVTFMIAVAVGSNIALRLLARQSRLNTILYLIYLGVMFGRAGVWLSSIISTFQTAIIAGPVAVGYWIYSWTSIGRR